MRLLEIAFARDHVCVCTFYYMPWKLNSQAQVVFFTPKTFAKLIRTCFSREYIIKRKSLKIMTTFTWKRWTKHAHEFYTEKRWWYWHWWFFVKYSVNNPNQNLIFKLIFPCLYSLPPHQTPNFTGNEMNDLVKMSVTDLPTFLLNY